MATALTITTWNVLAAPWTSPTFYPDAMDASVLHRTRRADLVGDGLVGLESDVMLLQETTPSDLAISCARIPGCEMFAAENGRELWSNWSTPAVPWEPNGTAIVWRSEAFDDVTTGAVGLSGDGNNATWMRARHGSSGTRLRLMSVHLDADGPELRRLQLSVALAWYAAESGVVDIIAGDCNEDTVGTDLGAMCEMHGFVDALNVIGCMDPTHPYARPSDDYAPIARLDHVLVRGGLPISGSVIDHGVWDIDIPGARMEEHLRRTGSDHLPVRVTLGL